MLSLWLDLLLASQDDPQERKKLAHNLAQYVWSMDGTSTQSTSTFFRVYFARPGTLSSITLSELPLAPVVKHIFLKKGDVIPAHSREIFLGQLLWAFDRCRQVFELERLSFISASALDIQYQGRDC